MRTAEAERADPRHVASGEQFVGLGQADIVALPSTPDTALLRPTVELLAEVSFAPVLGDAVRPVVAVMGDDLVTKRLRMSDRGAKLLLAAQCRFDGEDLRVAAVVPAAVPAHQAELGPADPLAVELVEDVPQPAKIAEHPHRRFRVGCLLGNLVGYRLDPQANPNLQGLRRIRQFG